MIHRYLIGEDVCMTRFSGPWTRADHELIRHFDTELATALPMSFPDAESILDVGCGFGKYLEPFQAASKRVLGIEPFPMGPQSVPIIEGNVLLADPIADRQFDLVICLEVAEHIERQSHDALFDFIRSHCSKSLAFSGAVPNQGGDGHVAERPENEWLEEMTKRGFVLDSRRTAVLRESATLWWYKNNIMAFNLEG